MRRKGVVKKVGKEEEKRKEEINDPLKPKPLSLLFLFCHCQLLILLCVSSFRIESHIGLIEEPVF